MLNLAIVTMVYATTIAIISDVVVVVAITAVVMASCIDHNSC